MVVEHPHVTTSDLRDMIFDHLVAGGWLDLLGEAAMPPAGGDDDPTTTSSTSSTTPT